VQIVTNQKFIDSHVKFGRWGSTLGFLVLMGGFGVSFLGPEWILPSYVCLISGFMLFTMARYNSIRYDMHPREDEVLANSLKGLDVKYRLINYTDDLPVPHFLLSPYGIVVLETRHHWGEIVNQGSKWRQRRSFWEALRSMAVGSLGNPSKDAQRGVEAVRRYLRERLGEEQAAQVAVEGIVVFTSPKAHVIAEQPAVPVVAPKELRSYIRTAQGREKMPASLAKAVADIFEAPAPETRKAARK